MRLLGWLFGKKEGTTVAAPLQKKDSGTALASKHPVAAVEGKGAATGPLEADNLKRWRESGKARAWVEKRQGRWNHDDWLGLLEELRRSPFWPMQPDAVGLVLEDEKRQWLGRN
jgi:hypothetical protein